MSERLAISSAALFLLGLVAGSRLDPVPETASAERCGYRLLEADFHMHTRFSDGLLPPPDVVLQARRRGLDAIAVTEHNSIFAGQLAQAVSPGSAAPPCSWARR